MRQRFAILLLLTFIATVATADTLRNGDIVKLVSAGFELNTVIQKIRTSDAAFDVSTDGLIELKKSGVDDAIVREMLRRQSEMTATAAAPAPATEQMATVTIAPTTVLDPAPAVQTNPSTKPKSQKFNMIIRTGSYGTCKAAVTIDRAGVRSTGCHDHDVKLRWDAVQKICTANGERGHVEIITAQKDYVIETTQAVTAEEFITAAREYAPKVKVGTCK